MRISQVYQGPPDSANGGYACGLFVQQAAQSLGTSTPLAVQLHAPPPLGAELTIKRTSRRIHVWSGQGIVATVSPDATEVELLPPVSHQAAEAASEGFAGRVFHPFPTCVICGSGRTDQAAFHLSPGPLDGQDGSVACTWTPRSEVSVELMWAVLDCPGGWTLDQVPAPWVLSRMTARIASFPVPGETTVAVAHGKRNDERSAQCLSALYRTDGTELGRALATWSRLSPANNIGDIAL
jgi:hypothetical protein